MPGLEVGAATSFNGNRFNAAGRALRGCERGPTVERSEIGGANNVCPRGANKSHERASFYWLAALAVRRQAPGPPRGGPARLPGGVKTPPYKAPVSGSS